MNLNYQIDYLLCKIFTLTKYGEKIHNPLIKKFLNKIENRIKT